MDTKKAILIAKESIELSKKYLNEYNNEMANYVLRDLEITKKAGLSDLSWAMDRNGCCKNDILALVSYIEKYMKRKI